MPRAAIYARVSTHIQASEGYSLDEQLRTLPELARSRGFEVIDEQDIYSDIESGANDDRPGYNLMLSNIVSGLYSAVFVIERSRLSRTSSRAEEERIIKSLKSCGCTVITPTSILDISSLEGEFMWDILAAVDRSERKRLRARLNFGLKAKWKRGQWPGFPATRGYEIGIDPLNGKKRFFIDSKEMEPVKIAFKMYKKGHSITYIIKELSQKGYKDNNGQKLNPRTVFRWLTNPHYAGFTHRGLRTNPKDKDSFLLAYNHFLEPIVSKEDFTFIQHALPSLAKGSQYTRQHPLSGILLCPICSLPVNAGYSPKRGEHFYLCPGRERKKRKCYRKKRRNPPRRIAHQMVIPVIQKLLEFLRNNRSEYKNSPYAYWMISNRLSTFNKYYSDHFKRIEHILLNTEEKLDPRQDEILGIIVFMFFETLKYKYDNEIQRRPKFWISSFTTRWNEKFFIHAQNNCLYVKDKFFLKEARQAASDMQR